MALADAKSHVKLNGLNYILIEESYEKRAQQPFSARFATGDPSEGDNSFWQFLSQRGWTSEGQEKFETTTKYRQSAGWDIRDGKPRLAKAATSLTLAAALPAQLGLVTGGTAVLYEDFEAPSSIDATKWNAIPENGNINQPGFYPKVATVASSRRSTSGLGFGGNNANTDPTDRVPARSTGQYESLIGVNFTQNGVIRDDTTMSSTGEWEFIVYTNTSAVDKIHAAFVFCYGGSGGYILEIYGADMNRARLIRSSAAFPTGDKTSDTIVKTFDGTGGTTAPVGGSASARTYKITRNSSGNFEVFENGVSLGTVTDTTHSVARYVGYFTLVGLTTPSGSNPVTAQSTWIDDIKLPSLGSADAGVASNFVNYNNGLYTCWYTNDTIFTQTTLLAASVSSNLPLIMHINARDIAVWSRDGQPTASKNTFLAATRGQVVRVYNASTQVFTGALTIYGSCVIPISSTVLVVLGTTGENNGVPAFEVLTFTAEAWTLSGTQKVVTLDGNTQGMVVSSAALDSSGDLYFAVSDLSNSAGSLPSRLCIVTATDLIATRPTVTSALTFSDFVIRGIFAMAGTIYLHGARIRGTESFASVLKYPSTVMWESTLGKALYPNTAAINLNHGVAAVWKNVDNVLFLGMNDLALWDPVLRMDLSGNVLEVASFNSGQFSTAASNILAVAEWSGQFYLLNAQAGTIYRTGTSRGALGASFATCVLQLSDMGGNTALINKTLNSVIVELSAAMVSGETLSVIVNGTTVGTMVTADGTRKEIALSSELTSSTFTTKLSLLQSATWTGYVKAVMLKYVPTQFKKKAWGFGIRATKRLKFGDGSHESRTPSTMFSDIEAAWASNTPITFIDVDGTSYSVLITDFKQKRPLLSIDRQSGNESFYFVEALEV
jgi:hypothetical protein